MEESLERDRFISQRYSSRESSNLWDDTKTVLFREVVDSDRVTLGSSFEVVDIKPLKLASGDKSEDIVLTLSWDKVKVQKYHYSSCQLDAGIQDLKNFLNDMCQDNYSKLCQLCLKLFRNYGAKVMRVSANPVTLIMAHQSAEMCQAMQQDGCNIVGLFASVLALESFQHLKLHWRQQRRKSPGQKIGTQNRVQDDVMDSRRTHNIANVLKNPSEENLQFAQSSEPETVGREDTYPEALLHSFVSSNDSLWQTLEPVSMVTRNDSRRGGFQVAQPISISDDSFVPVSMVTTSDTSESKRESFQMTQPISTSDDSFVQIPESLSMVTTRDTSDSRSENLSLTKPVSCGVMTSVSQTSTNSYQIYPPCRVSTPEESFTSVKVTKSRDMEGVYVCGSGDWDPSHTRPKTVHSTLPDDMETSTHNTAQVRPEHSTRRCEREKRTGYSRVEAEQFLSAIGVSGNSDEVNRLTETVGFALVDDLEMPPKAKCLDTILCLDVSSSMGEDGFEEMKKIACSFIDGVEDIAEHHDIEENISVVTFGGRSRIEHHLSNDYGSIRDAIDNLQFGGRSPLFEALLISLCALRGRGGSLSISGVHKIHPRLIIITDGKPSDEKENTTMDVEKVDHNVTIRLMTLMQKFNAKTNSSPYPRPVIWIPVGNANKEFITSMAKIGGGEVRSSQDVMKLCRYQRIQGTIGKTFAYIQKGMCHDSGDLTDDIKVLIDAFSGDLYPDDKAEVLDTVKAKLEGKHGYDCEDDDPRGFDNILEVENFRLPRLGSRVIRGPHWRWQNQDTDGPGTVINHMREEKDRIWVLWDNGNHNIYRFGDRDCYDVVVVTDQPRYIRSDMMIDIGCEVTRGPDWEERYRDQDGGPGGVGVVIRRNENGQVKVRWNLTHAINSYRYGQNEKLDLLIRDPADILKDGTARLAVTLKSSKTSPVWQDNQETPREEFSDDSRWVWQWKDETGRWHLYPEDDIHKMETAYRRRPDGSCLINRCGVSCRVMFKGGIERGVDTDTRVDVRRQRMTEDDTVVIKATEESLH